MVLCKNGKLRNSPPPGHNCPKLYTGVEVSTCNEYYIALCIFQLFVRTLRRKEKGPKKLLQMG